MFNVINIQDAEKEIYNSYAPRFIPTTYIIDTDGKVTDISTGSINEKDLIQIIEKK